MIDALGKIDSTTTNPTKAIFDAFTANLQEATVNLNNLHRMQADSRKLAERITAQQPQQTDIRQSNNVHGIEFFVEPCPNIGRGD